MEHNEIDAVIDSLGLTFRAEFVPFSRSRNAKKVTKPGDLSLNWKVRIEKGARKIETDYMQGIGHISGNISNARMTNDAWEALKFACETGKTPRPNGGSLGILLIGAKPIPQPLARDVMYSLSMDSSVLDAGSFEEWAGDFGYDADSREAEKIYNACMDIALKLRAMIGEDGLAQLRFAFQNY